MTIVIVTSIVCNISHLEPALPPGQSMFIIRDRTDLLMMFWGTHLWDISAEKYSSEAHNCLPDTQV